MNTDRLMEKHNQFPGALGSRLAAACVAFAALVSACTSTSLESITISGMDGPLAKGHKRQLVAQGNYGDKSSQDLSSLVKWSSSDTSIATVSNDPGTNGLVASLALGSATLSATYLGRSGSRALTIEAPIVVSISVAAPSPTLAKGTSQQLTATGVLSDSTTLDLSARVTWTSADSGVAAVADLAADKGLARALSPGSAVITAALEGKQGSTTLRVTDATLRELALDPGTSTIAKGTSVEFVATGTFSDNSTQDLTSEVTWASGDAAVAVVSNAARGQGRASGVGLGATTISATFAGRSASAPLTVSAATLSAIVVTSALPAIAKGTTQQLVATGTFSDATTQNLTGQVTWTSAATTVVTLSGTTSGLATGLVVGSAEIRAAFGGKSGATTLQVTDATLSSLQVTPDDADQAILVGGTQQFQAVGTFSDGSTQDLTSAVAWSSDDEDVATLSSALGSYGRATGIASGAITVSATLLGKSDSTTLTVNEP